MKRILIFLSGITFVMSLAQWGGGWVYKRNYYPWDYKGEKSFEGKYQNLDNLEKMTNHIDSIIEAKGISKIDSPYFVNEVDTLIRKRFFHGYATYFFKDNYIIYILGEYIWSDLNGIVEPNDILKRNRAMCSQQAIVFMEILKQYGYKVRKAELNLHFCFEVFYKGNWHLYDTNNEIYFGNNGKIPSLAYVLAHKEEFPPEKIYPKLQKKASTSILDVKEHKVGKANDFPAKNIRLFHKITEFLSHTLWAFFGLGAFFLHQYKKKLQFAIKA